MTLKIRVNKEIDAPGHGKDVVDDVNARDKRYLRGELLDYQGILPELAKAFVFFVMTPVNHLLVFHINAKKILQKLLLCRYT